MFTSLSLVSPKTFESFFVKHNIPWEGQINPDISAMHQLMIDAFNTSYLFGMFVSKTLVNERSGGVITNFAHKEEAYEMYGFFVNGYVRRVQKATLDS